MMATDDSSSEIELVDKLNTKVFSLESETNTLRNEVHELEGLVRQSVNRSSIPVHEKTSSSSSSCRKCPIVILVLILLVSGICYVKFDNVNDIEEWAHEGLNSIENFVHHLNVNKTSNTPTSTTGNNKSDKDEPTKTNTIKATTTEDVVKNGQGKKDLTFIDVSHPSLLECFYDSGKNLALKKPTSQSSTRNNAISSLAVDGIREQTDHSTAITKLETSPWWTVDLERDVVVDRVLIFNKDKGNSKHLENYHVELINAGGDVVHHFHREETFYRVSYVEFPSGSKGRYVTVRLEGETAAALKLVEVEVYGKAKSQMVRNCLKRHVDKMKDRLKKRDDQNMRNRVNNDKQHGSGSRTDVVPKGKKKRKKKKKIDHKQNKGKKEDIKQNQTEAVQIKGKKEKIKQNQTEAVP